MQTEEPDEMQKALVIDVPLTATTEEATSLINEPYQRGFHIHRALECGDRTRIIFVLSGNAGKPKTETQTPETKAIQFMRDNREMSVPQLCAAFKALRFVRSPVWVRAKLVEIITADRRMVK